MKRASAVAMVAVVVLLQGAEAAAQPPPLKAMVEQLQKAPGDNALREKVINAALKMKPAPAPSVEALKLQGKGEYLMQQAKAPADFVAAAQTFRAAANLAPWNASAYFNEGVAYERGQRAALAIEAFNWYLKAAPGARDTVDVIKRVGGLEIAAQEQDRAGARNAVVKAEYERLKALVDGKTFGNFLSCSSCTKEQSQGANWYEAAFQLWLTASVAYYEDADPRVEISLVQSGAESKYNGLNYVFIGRPAEGARAVGWKKKARAWGAQDKSWWNDEQPSWIYASDTRMRWCDWYAGSDCAAIPPGATDPWDATSPTATYAIVSIERR